MTGWRTEHEVAFLKGLGKWSESRAVSMRGRKEMLKRYLHATQWRDDWDGISRPQVVGYAEQCLDMEG